jgi:Xaa-Pro aminopeptidase
MSDEDTKHGEIIPPDHSLRDTGREVSNVSQSNSSVEALKDPRGVLESAKTGWQAKRQAKALNELAERERAQANYIRARGEVADSAITAARSIGELREINEIVQNDKMVRAEKRKEELKKAQRAAEYADIGLEATKAMRQHTIDLVKARKERNLMDAIGALPADQEETSGPSEIDDIAAALGRDIYNARAAGKEKDAEELEVQLKARMTWLEQQKK